MRYVANVTLIENSTAGNAPKVFPVQTVDIQRVNLSTHMGADGKLSPAQHPSTVRWFGGKASDFERMTDVMISAIDGTISITAQILRNFEAPHDISGGVQFQVIM